MTTKPSCKIVGTDGNVFAIISTVAKTLKQNGMKAEAKAFTERAFQAHSYDEVLQMLMEYVDPC